MKRSAGAAEVSNSRTNTDEPMPRFVSSVEQIGCTERAAGAAACAVDWGVECGEFLSNLCDRAEQFSRLCGTKMMSVFGATRQWARHHFQNSPYVSVFGCVSFVAFMLACSFWAQLPDMR